MADLDPRSYQEAAPRYTEREASNNLCQDAYHGFQGLDLGIFRIGSQDCSLALGIDLGIFNGGASIGKHTGAGAEVGVPGASVGAGLGANIDERHGLTAGVGAGAELFPIAGADVNLGASVGPRTGVYADGHAYVGPVSAGAYGEGYADHRGLHARSGAGADIAGLAGAHTRVRADLGERTGVAVRNHAHLGPAAARLDGGVYLATNPKAYLSGDFNPNGLY